MCRAVIEDLVADGKHAVVTTRDPRVRGETPPSVAIVTSHPADATLSPWLIDACDAVWLIAPETGGALADLAARISARRVSLLGPSAPAIRRASDKLQLARTLRRAGIPFPATTTAGREAFVAPSAGSLEFPMVVKPRFGAGGDGVGRVDRRSALPGAVERTRVVGEPILQEFVRGVPASVSLLCSSTRCTPLALSSQAIELGARCRYGGGTTPLRHRLARRAMDVAAAACDAIGGLRGYVGVDVVLSDREVYVIEVNPRVTTAYLGVRAAFGLNLAGLVLDALDGRLPGRLRPRASVAFRADGAVRRMRRR